MTGLPGGLDAALPLLGAVASAVCLVRNHEIVWRNGPAERLLPSPEKSCHRALLGRDSPCQECPIAGDTTTAKRKVSLDGVTRMVACARIPEAEGWIVATVRDVTKEACLAQEFVLLRKELAAKEVLAKGKDLQLELLRSRSLLIWENFPEGLAIVDREMVIEEANPALKEGFDASRGQRCYTLFGRKEPCSNCPVAGHDYVQRYEKAVIGHKADGRFITEEVVYIPGTGKSLIIFKDSTKQVNLIEQIREQRDTIARQKELFEDLSEFMSTLQSSQDPSEAAALLLSMLDKWGGVKRAMLIAEGLRRGSLWFNAAHGLDDSEQEAMERAYFSMSRRGEGAVMIPDELFPKRSEEWMQFPVLSDRMKQLGLLIMEGIPSPTSLREIKLFLEPFVAFVKNRILSMRLEQRALRDGLTGLYNRSYFQEALEQEMGKCERLDIPFSVIVADANGLKEINDTLGHEAGDALIMSIAELIMNNVRENDVAARLGGDEFCVLLPNTASHQAQHVIMRLRRSCESMKIDLGRGNVLTPSVSMGVASSDAVGPKKVLAAADRAMYEEKKRYYQKRGGGPR